jgi:hypothetical protein
VSELCPHCTVAIIWPYIIIVFCCCDTLSLRINFFLFFHVTVAYYFLLCVIFGVVPYCFFHVPFVCASPLFLLVVASFGNFADFTPPLTSVWRTLLWHVTPFCALLLHVTEILHVFAYHVLLICYFCNAATAVAAQRQWRRGNRVISVAAAAGWRLRR